MKKLYVLLVCLGIMGSILAMDAAEMGKEDSGVTDSELAGLLAEACKLGADVHGLKSGVGVEHIRTLCEARAVDADLAIIRSMAALASEFVGHYNRSKLQIIANMALVEKKRQDATKILEQVAKLAVEKDSLSAYVQSVKDAVSAVLEDIERSLKALDGDCGYGESEEDDDSDS